MAHTVSVTITTAQHSFAAGTTSTGIKVTLVSTAAGATPVSQTLTSGPWVATFADVAAGEYNIEAVALDANGANLGDAISGTATVAPDNVELDVPASMIVSVQ
jgi:hypothetical protein